MNHPIKISIYVTENRYGISVVGVYISVSSDKMRDKKTELFIKKISRNWCFSIMHHTYLMILKCNTYFEGGFKK